MNKLLTALCAFAFAATAYAQGTTPAAKPAEPMKADAPKAAAPVKAEAAKPVVTDAGKPAATDGTKPATSKKHKSKKKKAKPATPKADATPADKPAK